MADSLTGAKVPNKEYDNQTLSECIKKLYLDMETADINFVIESDNGSTERVPVHKSILASVSDVFKAMFYGDLKEDEGVKMTDVTVAAVKEFLQFFYFGKVQLTEENIAEVMHLGHKYNVTKCEQVCIEFLKDTLNEGNVCIAMDLAILYDQDELIKLCEKQVLLNTSAVLKSNSFIEGDRRILAHILKMNLFTCSEVELFEACMEWVKAQSNQNVLSEELVEAQLGELFYEIRFRSMTVQQFITLATSYDSVLSNNFKEITKMIAMPEFQPKKFNRNPRQIPWNSETIIKCNRAIDSAKKTKYQLDEEEKSTFSTNQLLLLGGFVCEGIEFKDVKYKDLRSTLSVEVTITEASSLRFDGESKICLNFRASLETLGTEVILPLPILIRTGFYYEIRISKFPDAHYHFSKPLIADIQIDSEITIKFHNNSMGHDGRDAALISELMINRVFEYTQRKKI